MVLAWDEVVSLSGSWFTLDARVRQELVLEVTQRMEDLSEGFSPIDGCGVKRRVAGQRK